MVKEKYPDYKKLLKKNNIGMQCVKNRVVTYGMSIEQAVNTPNKNKNLLY